MYIFDFCGSMQLFVFTGSFLSPRTGFKAPDNLFSPVFHLHASYTKMWGDKPEGHQSELLSGGGGTQIPAPTVAHFSTQGLTKPKSYR